MCLERKGKKTGTGKKLVFPVFGENRQKRVKKGVERRKKGWKDVERRRTAVPRRSKLSNLARFRFLCRLKPVFAPVPTPFLPLSKPVLDPFPNPFLPLSTPVLVPFLYCLAIISRCAPVAAQPLDHVGSSPVRGPVGGLYSWRGDARDQFA